MTIFRENAVRCKVCGIEDRNNRDPQNNFESMISHVTVVHAPLLTHELSKQMKLPRDFMLKFPELKQVLEEREKLHERVNEINSIIRARCVKEVEVVKESV